MYFYAKFMCTCNPVFKKHLRKTAIHTAIRITTFKNTGSIVVKNTKNDSRIRNVTG